MPVMFATAEEAELQAMIDEDGGADTQALMEEKRDLVLGVILER